MIFRRFMQRFRQQPWASIVTEVIIVIIGVFIGMQASNWNQERETHIKAAVFTARLKSDLRKEAWAYQSLIDYGRQTNKHQRRVLEAMAGEIELSDEQFLISAYRATQYKFNVRFRATYDELVSTGNIGLITHQALLETSITLYTTSIFDTITRKASESEYRRLFRETVPASIQQGLLDRCGDRYTPVLDYDAIRHMIDYPCTLDVAPASIHAAARALKSEPRFVPALRIRFADTQTAMYELRVQGQDVRERLHAVANEGT